MSRRKQFKPIRVSDVLPPQPGVLDFSNGGANYREENGVDRNEEEPMDMHVVAVITCDKCPEAFRTREDLSEHLRTRHVEVRTRPEDFPTAYHRLGREFQEEFVPNGHNNQKEESLVKEKHTPQPSPQLSQQLSQQSQPPTQSPSRPSPQPIQPSTPSKPSPVLPSQPLEEGALDLAARSDSNRIFHQDAYCDICDREFCNKYFLKTHKANKHGVYENLPFSYGSNTSGFPNLPIPPSLSLPPKDTTPIKVIAPSPPSTPKVEAIIQSMIKAETPKGPPPVTVLASNKALTETTSSSSKSTHPDMEDYCEICQKHFCNKYYLKKHKQDVHGIVPETPSSSSKRNRASFDIPFTSTSSPMILPHNITSIAGLPAMPNMPGVMLLNGLNPFMPQVALLQHHNLLPHQQLHPHSLQHSLQHSLPHVSQPLQLSPRTTEPHQTTAKSSSLPSPSESSKNHTIFNQEAYCEVCHKEFCNKMFLKIHKASKHGLFENDGIEIPLQYLHMAKDLSKEPLKSENESQRSPNSNQDKEVMHCKPCNKDFYSKYSYKVHSMSMHGSRMEMPRDLTKEPEGSDAVAPKMEMPGSEGLLKVANEAQVANNNNNPTTMFGNMIAAKLADRVVCDICNKELCNKYFLKAHKLKVHGIDIGLSENPEQKGESQSKQSLLPKPDIKDMPMFVPELFAQELLARAQNAKKIDLNLTPPSDKPTYEELMKLGIDPEAYCEICKKEFCSKYFLRTHKLNIHGIKADKFDERDKPYPLLPMMQGLPMMPGFPFLPSSLSGMPLLAPNLPLTPTSNSFKLEQTDPDSYEKRTWRWKEPVNNSRVICDICNKEVCNKYFLRAHKLNKHGITPSDKSLSPTISGSPALSDCDTASNASSQPDQNNYQSKPENLSLSKPFSKPSIINDYDMEEPTDLSNNSGGEICHLCDRHFKNGKWLKAHIMKDHASWPRSDALDMRVPTKQFKLDQGVAKPCEICGITFPNEITMQLHLIQEHNAQVTLKTDDVQNGESDSASPKSEEGLGQRSKTAGDLQEDYSCVLCDYKTKWLSNLASHEEKMHNISKEETSFFACKHCPKSFPDDIMLSYHTEQYHAKNMDISGSPNRQELKQFKCTMCSETFTSRVMCHKHFQRVHAKKSKRSDSKLSCTFCPFRTHYPQLLKRHVERRHTKINGNGNGNTERGHSESDEREMSDDVSEEFEEDMEQEREEEMEDDLQKMKTFEPIESPVRHFQSSLDESRLVKPRFSPLSH